MRRALVTAVVTTTVAGVLALGPGPAGAASFGVADDGWVYSAAPGEDNDVVLTVGSTGILLTDVGAASLTGTLPAKCVAEPAAEGIAVRCVRRKAITIRIVLGDGDDSVDGSGLPSWVALDVIGGEGETIVQGGAGRDHIDGGDGRDTLYGGAGDDVVLGGEGDDYVRGHGGNDQLDGGPGLGFLIGDQGADTITGGDGLDFVTAGPGADDVDGGGGNDSISGGPGVDTLVGGAGLDDLNGGPDADVVDGGDDDDVVRLADGGPDEATCGAGRDVVRSDNPVLDVTDATCERVVWPQD